MFVFFVEEEDGFEVILEGTDFLIFFVFFCKAFGAAGLAGIEQSAMFSVKVRALVQRKLFGGGTNFAEQDLRVLLNDLTSIGTDDKRLLPVNTPLDATCTSLLSALIARHVASSDASDVLSIVMNRLRKVRISVFPVIVSLKEEFPLIFLPSSLLGRF